MSRVFHINTAKVVYDVLDGEVIAIRNDTGAYYSMTGPAASIWVALGGGVDTETAASLLLAHHAAGDVIDPGVVAKDLERFADDLVSAELLILAADSAGGAPSDLPAETAGTGWITPHLEVFNDMADLLLFDPIHEVGPEGWPNLDSGTS